MLDRIHIQNIGIIEDLEFEFDNKINVLTGETGSGKTLIIDSINLATGNRVNKDIIRNGQEKALVELCFNADLPDISQDGLVILSRQIFANGKNVCKINGQMATMTQLKQIGDMLIDIHGQHDTTNLLDKSKYIELLDNYIGAELLDLKNKYSEYILQRKNIIQKRKELSADPEERNRKIDLLQYQIEEICNANLQIGEEEKLVERKNLFQNSQKIVLALNETYSILNDKVVQSVNKCWSNMQSIAGFDKEYEKIFTLLQETFYNLEEVSRDVGAKADNMCFEEEEQQKVFDRLDYIFSLKRKYGNTVQDVIQYCEKLQIQLDELLSSEKVIEQLNKEYEENTFKLFNISLKMHNMRMDKAKEIEKLVNKELIALEMPKAKFDIVVEFNNNIYEYDKMQQYQFTQNGLDDVQFLICTNVGSKAQMIGKIASGGELSRITLALKVVFANSYHIPSIIFDEIDTGLSGQACIALANKFKNLSNKHQIVLITHHPNIAAIGTNNILVGKDIDRGITKSYIKVLNEQEKIQEVARILSGNEKTDIALKHAEQLVKNI